MGGVSSYFVLLALSEKKLNLVIINFVLTIPKYALNNYIAK